MRARWTWMLICLMVSPFCVSSAWSADDEEDFLVLRIYTQKDHWVGLKHVSWFRADGYQPRPGNDVVSRMRVEWGEAVPYRPWGKLWLRGRIVVAAGEGQPARAVNWFQGLRILLARQPNKEQDWSHGPSRQETLLDDVVARPDGSFRAEFDLADLPRAVASLERYQVGISLAEDDGQMLVWNATQPPLAGSVAMVPIPGPPRLSPTLERINSASTWENDPSRTAELVRAVNVLRTLGKQKALAALREYLESAAESDQLELDPANIETGDRNGVFWIVRLLFEPARAGARIPEPMLGAPSPSPDAADRELWPLFPIELADDIPFMLVEGWTLAGRPEDPSSHLVWAERYGVLRAQPLRPADNPMRVAERLASLPKTHRLAMFPTDARRTGDNLKRQAWRMVAGLLPAIELDNDQLGEFTSDEWRRLRKASRDRNLHWDETQQAFAVDAP